MQTNNSQEEIEILERQLKVVTIAFDNAIRTDMVLKDAKHLFNELKIISAKLLDLRKQHASIER